MANGLDFPTIFGSISLFKIALTAKYAFIVCANYYLNKVKGGHKFPKFKQKIFQLSLNFARFRNLKKYILYFFERRKKSLYC
jgi:hypothetical protein